MVGGGPVPGDAAWNRPSISDGAARPTGGVKLHLMSRTGHDLPPVVDRTTVFFSSFSSLRRVVLFLAFFE